MFGVRVYVGRVVQVLKFILIKNLPGRLSGQTLWDLMSVIFTQETKQCKIGPIQHTQFMFSKYGEVRYKYGRGSPG